MLSLSWYINHTVQRIGTQIMEMLCDWNSLVAFHAGEVQATCAISSVVDFQNLLCTILVLRVVFNWKPSRHHQVASTADSRSAKRGLWRWVFIVTGLAADIAGYNVGHDWRPTTGVFRGVDWRVERRLRAIKAEKVRKKRLEIEAASA